MTHVLQTHKNKMEKLQSFIKANASNASKHQISSFMIDIIETYYRLVCLPVTLCVSSDSPTCGCVIDFFGAATPLSSPEYINMKHSFALTKDTFIVLDANLVGTESLPCSQQPNCYMVRFDRLEKRMVFTPFDVNIDIGARGWFGVKIADNRILTCGMQEYTGDFLHVLDVSEKSYTPIRLDKSIHRVRSGAAVYMKDNTVLIVGGMLLNTGVETSICILFNLTDNTWKYVASMNQSRFHHNAILLNNGRVLVCGGFSLEHGFTNSCEIYNPLTDRWNKITPMHSKRAGGFLFMQKVNSRTHVCIIGGFNHAEKNIKDEYLDPETGCWEQSTQCSSNLHLGSTLTFT